MIELRRALRDFGGIAFVLALLLAVYALPPDTSLSEVRAAGALRVCVPTAYPPLVTGDPERPGIDVELLREVTDRIGVNLQLSPNDAMGRDFNPRRWNITRARCQVLAGGVVASPLTRSFLDTGPTYAETGWAVMAPEPLADIGGKVLGVLTVISGLDRIALASYLRRENVTARVVRRAEELVDGIAQGTLDGGVTEALLAGQLAAPHDWSVEPLPAEIGRYDLVFGLWKSDLTLKRAISGALNDMKRDGTVEAILERYGAQSVGQESVSAASPQRTPRIGVAAITP